MRSQAPVDATAEPEVTVRVAVHVDQLGSVVDLLVGVGGAQEKKNLIAILDRTPA